MISDDGIVDGSVKKMEKEEGDFKKVECLRGRLIAERAASKLAKQEAHQMECKVGELESQLKSETKLRKRTHKRLKYLINKLHSLNIPYLSKDLENSDMYSVSSSIFSALTQVQDKEPKALIKIYENGEKKDYEDFVSEISTSNQSSIEPTGFESCQNCNNANVDNQRLRSLAQKYDEKEENKQQARDESQNRPIEEGVTYVKNNCDESNENDRKMDGQSYCSSRDAEEEKKDNGEKSKEAQDDYVDESLALVLVDLPKETPQVTIIDPLILDANVKQVLDALNRAKQRLIWSMENRHMIRIGSK